VLYRPVIGCGGLNQAYSVRWPINVICTQSQAIHNGGIYKVTRPKRDGADLMSRFVCLLLNSTSALFMPLVPRIIEVENMRHVKNAL